MKAMIVENTLTISSIGQKGWLKVIEHKSMMESGSYPKLHNYDITSCAFCGILIKGQADPFTK